MPAFRDDLFEINDSADNTKRLAFQLSGITTATKRTITIPDSDFTIPTSSGAAVQDEGVPKLTATTLNFTGAGVTASDAGSGVATVNIPGGAGEAFPVGSVFIGVVSTNPGTLLGYGTWSAFGAGRVMVGLDSGDTDFDTVEETGGAKTVASAGTNAAEATHTHSVTSNVAVAAHTPTQPTIAWPAGVPTHSGTAITDHAANVTGAASAGATQRGTTASTLTLAAHTHTTPLLSHTVSNQGTVAWPAGVPTASGGGVDAHGVTNNAVTSGAGSSHNHAFTGSATSVVQPYIVCYFWKRTA